MRIDKMKEERKLLVINKEAAKANTPMEKEIIIGFIKLQ